MMALRTFLALVFLGLLAGPLSAADAPERESLEKAIPHGITLLEAKNYKDFLKAFLTEGDLKAFSDGGPFDTAAAEWGKEMGADLLKALKVIKDLKPKLDEKAQTATYALPEAIAGEKEVIFKKVGKLWYLAE